MKNILRKIIYHFYEVLKLRECYQTNSQNRVQLLTAAKTLFHKKYTLIEIKVTNLHLLDYFLQPLHLQILSSLAEKKRIFEKTNKKMSQKFFASYRSGKALSGDS